MTDIVAILRTESGVNYPEGKYLAEIMADAADEIEKLRATLREIANAGLHPTDFEMNTNHFKSAVDLARRAIEP